MDLKSKYYAYGSGGIGVAAAEAIVFEIMADFTDRRGLRQEWDNIDDDIQNEIIQKWVSIAAAKTTDTYDPTSNVQESNV